MSTMRERAVDEVCRAMGWGQLERHNAEPIADAVVAVVIGAARKACEAIAERHMNQHGKSRMWGQGVDVVCTGETTAMECALAIRDLDRNPDPLKPEPEGKR